MVRESCLMVDAIAQKNNIFTRLDSRIKLILCAAGLALVLSVPWVQVPLGVFVLLLGAMIAVRIPVRLILGRILPPFVLGVIVFFLMVLLRHGQVEVFALQLAGYRLAVYKESLELGLGFLAKIMGSVSIVMFLSVTTPIYEIGYGMLWFRVPKVLVEILLLTYRYVFVIWDEAIRMRDAQTLRMGYPSWRNFSGWKRAVQSTVTLMGMVFIRAYDRAESTFNAMQVRAYNGNITGTRGWRLK